MNDAKRITSTVIWVFSLFFASLVCAADDSPEARPTSVIQVSAVTEAMRLEIEQMALSQLETTVNQPEIKLPPTSISPQPLSQLPQASASQ